MLPINKILSRIDGSFNEQGAGEYELTMLLGESTTAWSVFDKEKNKYILIESYGNVLPELTGVIPVLQLPYRDARIILENNKSTLIPEPLFDSDELSSYLSVTVDMGEEDQYLFDRLSQVEIINIYAVSAKLKMVSELHFPGKPVFHISSVLIESIWMNYKNQLAGTRLFIYIRKEYFHLLIFDKNQLIYSNVFHFKSPEDFIYFVIFVMEQLELNPEEIPVTLMGAIVRDSYLFELLFRYIRKVEFADRKDAVAYSYVFDDIPGHHYYPLLTRGL